MESTVASSRGFMTAHGCAGGPVRVRPAPGWPPKSAARSTPSTARCTVPAIDVSSPHEAALPATCAAEPGCAAPTSPSSCHCVRSPTRSAAPLRTVRDALEHAGVELRRSRVTRPQRPSAQHAPARRGTARHDRRHRGGLGVPAPTPANGGWPRTRPLQPPHRRLPATVVDPPLRAPASPRSPASTAPPRTGSASSCSETPLNPRRLETRTRRCVSCRPGTGWLSKNARFKPAGTGVTL